MSSWVVSVGTESDTFATANEKKFKLTFLQIRERVYHFVIHDRMLEVSSKHCHVTHLTRSTQILSYLFPCFWR